MDFGSYLIDCNTRKPLIKPLINKQKLRFENFPYFLPNEIVVHNTPDDCWVSFLGVVRDLTPLVKQYEDSVTIKPILAHAGKDISHWFNKRTGDIRFFVHPITGVLVPYCQHGPVPDIEVQVPSTRWRPVDKIPWWFDVRYVIGLVTENARPIRIMNVLSGEENLIKVCCEDNLRRIQERYNMFNSHNNSYTWKFESNVLDMSLTLDENNIPDRRNKFRQFKLPDDTYIPCLMIYYNDDLT